MTNNPVVLSFTSAPVDSGKYGHESGFTLVELLVVLVVIGIGLSIVAVQLQPDTNAVLREESERLALLLENAGLEARSSGQAMAWSGEDTRYLFWKKNDYNDWIRLEDRDVFQPRILAEGLWLGKISVAGQPLRHGEKLVFSASAFTLPFRIRLSNTSNSTDIIGMSTGAVVATLNVSPNEPI